MKSYFDFVACLDNSIILSVTQYCPCIKEDKEGAQCDKLRPELTDATAFQIYKAHNLHEVFQWIKDRNGLCPIGHTAYRSKQPTHKYENNHKKEHHKHGLLHGRRIVRDNKSGTRDKQDEETGKEIDCAQMSRRNHAINKTCQPKTDSQHHKPDHPIRNELCQYEREFAYGRYVKLLDCSRFFFAYDV